MLDDGPLNRHIHKLIKKVRFDLHETFANPIRVVHSKPGTVFQVQTMGWGIFEIPITVHWNPDLQIPQQTLQMIHMLSFSRDDTYRRVAVRFKKEKVMPLLYPEQLQ